MKKTIFLVTIFFFTCFASDAQDYSNQAKTYFSNYLTTSSMIELISNSLPTLDDCKMVFIGQNAYTYFGYIEEIKSKLKEEKAKENQTFKDVKIETFSTQDIQNGTGNYVIAMKDIVDKLNKYVIFYKVEFLKEKGDEYGISYKYWLNINGKWVFFPKPNSAFEN
jgi:hypothetical protein